MPTLRSHANAERGSILRVHSYEIAVDMTGLLEGNELRAVSTIRFTGEPGASTFADCAAQVVSATLNGEDIPPSAIDDSRIGLDNLREDNVLVVRIGPGLDRPGHRRAPLRRSH